MGDTIYEQAAVRVTTEKMGDPRWAKILAQTVAELNSGKFYPQSYVDVIVQKYRGRYDVFDAYSFLQVHCAIRMGWIAVAQVSVGCTPVSDREEEEQNRRLAGLSYPFSAAFSGGGHDSDGTLKICQPVNALIQPVDHRGYVILPPDEYPLEAGTTSAHKTYMYLCNAWIDRTGDYIVGGQIPGVARWPYGQDKITILSNWFVDVDHSDFDRYVTNVYGTFDTTINPFEQWDKECLIHRLVGSLIKSKVKSTKPSSEVHHSFQLSLFHYD